LGPEFIAGGGDPGGLSGGGYDERSVDARGLEREREDICYPSRLRPFFYFVKIQLYLIIIINYELTRFKIYFINYR